MKCDHIKWQITLTSDNIKRVLLYHVSLFLSYDLGQKFFLGFIENFWGFYECHLFLNSNDLRLIWPAFFNCPFANKIDRSYLIWI